MPMSFYLRPENAGSQSSQMMWSNLTRGAHPYNFTGFCMALVVQWLMEINLSNGQTPAEIGRHLLQTDLGTHGYGGIASSQDIYGAHDPQANNHTAMVARHSGGSLRRENQVVVNNWNDHWLAMRRGIYNKQDDTIQLGERARVYSAHVSLMGAHSRWTRWLVGDEWGHALGLHCDGPNVYFFDPNYGVFIFDSTKQGTMSQFVQTVWGDYGANGGRVARIVTT